MPNHVDHDLIIIGNVSSLKEFTIFAKEEDHLLSANKFIPYPKEYSVMDDKAKEVRKNGDYSVKDGFNSGGYEWCIANWGTKWGIYNASIKSQKLNSKSGRIKYNFNSAWSPAYKIILAMSKKFKTLTFDMKYYECGMQYKGHYVVKNGEVIKDTDEKYTGSRGG